MDKKSKDGSKFDTDLRRKHHGKLARLRAHLAEGAAQAAKGEFAANFFIDDVIARAKMRARSSSDS